jgi:hypothetical protein
VRQRFDRQLIEPHDLFQVSLFVKRPHIARGREFRDHPLVDDGEARTAEASLKPTSAASSSNSAMRGNSFTKSSC